MRRTTLGRYSLNYWYWMDITEGFAVNTVTVFAQQVPNITAVWYMQHWGTNSHNYITATENQLNSTPGNRKCRCPERRTCMAAHLSWSCMAGHMSWSCVAAHGLKWRQMLSHFPCFCCAKSLLVKMFGVWFSLLFHVLWTHEYCT